MTEMSAAAADDLATSVNAALIGRGKMIVTAESCTGGLVAAALTDVPGSSAVVFGGFVSYSNDAKVAFLGVDAALIARCGAVSAEVAAAMAEGARRRAGVAVGVAVTGIAGPGGGSALKPVGLVHFACSTDAGTQCLERRFSNPGRQAIRAAAVRSALQLVLDCLER